MGRIISDGLTSANSSSAVLTATTTLLTGEAAQQGDLLLVGSDNLTYVAALPSDSAAKQLWRPPSGGPAVDNGVISALAQVGASSYNGSGNDLFDVVKLSNGNILHVWMDLTAVKAKFTILSPDGAVVVPETAIAGAAIKTTASANASAVAIPAGGFVISYVSSTNTGVATVFDNSGNVTTAQFTIEPTTTLMNIRIALLANGNLAFVARHGAPVRYGVFTLAGAAVKASTVLFNGTTTSGDRTIGVAALTGGGFVVAYQDASAASSVYHQRFDAAGTAQGATQTLLAGGNGINGFCYVVALTGGGYAVAGYISGAGAKMSVHDATGAIQGAVISLGTVGVEPYGNQLALAAAPNGDVGVCCTVGGLTVARYSAAGVAVVAAKVIDATGSTSAGITFNADGSAMVTGTTSGSVKVYQLSASMAVTNTMLTLNISTVTYPRVAVVQVTSTAAPTGACFLISFQTGGGLSSAVYFKTRIAMTLIGVALASALAASAIPVQFTGVATLRLSYGTSWATNQNGASPPGQRMNVVGNTAILYGVQPAAPTPIN